LFGLFLDFPAWNKFDPGVFIMSGDKDRQEIPAEGSAHHHHRY